LCTEVSCHCYYWLNKDTSSYCISKKRRQMILQAKNRHSG
jgi:hypothetical protein